MDRFNIFGFDSRGKKEETLRSVLNKGIELIQSFITISFNSFAFRFNFTVNTEVYCARTFTAHGRDIHATSFQRDIELAYADKEHRWSREMKKYGSIFKRIEKKLDNVYEQNQNIQKRLKKINQKPNEHANEIRLLLYLEEKKRI